MPPTLGMGANLALNDARMLLERISTAVDATWWRRPATTRTAWELVYRLMCMTMELDRHFGGGAIASMCAQD